MGNRSITQSTLRAEASNNITFFNFQVYGNGKQTRSFCYVSDLVDGLLALMAANYTLPVNIGNPVENTIQGKVTGFVNLMYMGVFFWVGGCKARRQITAQG